MIEMIPLSRASAHPLHTSVSNLLLVMYYLCRSLALRRYEFVVFTLEQIAPAPDRIISFARASVLPKRRSVELDTMTVPDFYTRLQMLCEVVRKFVLRPYI